MEQTALDKKIKKILEHKSILLVLVVVVVCIMFGTTLWSNYKTQAEDYKKQLKEKSSKNDLISAFDKSNGKLNEFVSFFPKQLSGDGLLSQVADYATQNNITILSVAPEEPQSHEEYITTGLRLNIQSKDFKSLISFFYTIETSPFPLRILHWSTKIVDKSDFINCDVNIVSIQLQVKQ